jgi:RIO kinase 1
LLEKKILKLDKKIDQMRKRVKGIEDYKIHDEVFDRTTLLTLYDLANKGVIDLLYGTIKTGKEANTFLGKRGDENLAVKIHRTGNRDYSMMMAYIDGDHRFEDIKKSKSKRTMVKLWVKKEFKNLKSASEHIRVPEPLASKNNVIVMEFLGDGNVPSPMLKNAKIKDPKEVFKKIKRDIKRLYKKAGLVHADLSEYNILMMKDEPIMIDFAQAVANDHPRGEEFLRRDVSNITRFFQKYFKIDEEKVFSEICG